ncbi:MAG: dTDP-4-dehydrorhamnose 3,5-epimerase [Pseudomonadota bacterium]
MEVRELALPGVYEISPPKFGDSRGFFSETFNGPKLAAAGLAREWVQDNHSYSAAANVLRGMHYQLPPFAQDKLVRAPKGRILDVVADIRRDSPTFGKWLSVELSAEAWNQLFVPKGFAHGFLTLEPDCEVQYKVTAVYAPDCDRSIRYDDEQLAIDWPVNGHQPELSEKDRAAPALADADLPDSWDN